jgi:hypothetical protein
VTAKEMHMHRSARIATVAVFGLIVASPVGYAIGSQQGDGSSGPAQDAQAGKAGVYAVIPPGPPSEALMERCEQELARDPGSDCAVFLDIAEKQQEGELDPGRYTKPELESALGTDIP